MRRTVTLGLLWLFLVSVLGWFRAALIPFALALLLAFILEPLVHFLSHRGIRGFRLPRVASVITIYIASMIFVALSGSWAVNQIERELAGLNRVTSTLVREARNNATAVIDRIERFAEDNQLPIDREEIDAVIEQNVIAALEEIPQSATKLLTFGRDVVGGTVRVVFGMFLVLMLTAFISIDRARIERFFYSLVPPEYRSAYSTIIGGMSVGLAGVVRGQVMICLVNGVFTFIGLWLLEVKLPLLLATVAASFSLIPIFGSILSTLPIVAMALTDSFAKGVFALLWVIGIHLIEANFLNPKIMGDSAKIHPVIVVFALIVGEQTAGLVGALFAVPVASVLVTLFQFLHRRALEADRSSEAETLIGMRAASGDRFSLPMIADPRGDLPQERTTAKHRVPNLPIVGSQNELPVGGTTVTVDLSPVERVSASSPPDERPSPGPSLSPELIPSPLPSKPAEE